MRPSIISLWAATFVGLNLLAGPLQAQDPLDAGVKPAQPMNLAQSSGAKTKRQPPPPGKGVRALFEQAQQLYNSGKYQEALTAYDGILRRYPGYEPALIQTAKTFYRLDRFQDSYNLFARINLQHLDAETSYEYGWSFYTNKQWEGAFYAFQKVPKGHALFDLANYYGGICAIKLRRYEEAEDMLDKAVVLPDKLSKSRALYVKHVQALKFMHQRSALAKERKEEREGLRKYQQSQRKIIKDKAPPPSDEYKHAGFKSVTKSALVRHTSQTIYEDKHGYKESDYTARINTFELRSGVLLPLPFKTKTTRRSAVGLQLMLGAENRYKTGSSSRIVIEEDSQDLQRQLTENLGTIEDVDVGSMLSEVWFEFPLPEGIWLAVGGSIDFAYPEFRRGLRTGSYTGYSELNTTVDRFTYGVELAYSETIDAKNKPVVTTTKAELSAATTLAINLSIGTTLTHKQFGYLLDADSASLDGPDTSTSGEVSLTQKLPMGFALGADAIYEYQANAIYHSMPTYGQIAADGQIISGRLNLTIEPPIVPWLNLSASQLLQQATWKVDNPDAVSVFEENVPDYISTLTFRAAVNLAF